MGSAAEFDNADVVSAEEVHAYWFGAEAWGQKAMWFDAGRDLDDDVRRFLPTVEAALRGDLDHWAGEPRGCVCLTVVLDQFTRHVFRDTSRFVDGDAAAQRWALHALEKRWDERLRSDERLFLILPLEHAEDPALQERALAEARCMATAEPSLKMMVPFVRQHAAIIFLFGRFPDRNKALGRTSTEEERAFLAAIDLPWFERP